MIKINYQKIGSAFDWEKCKLKNGFAFKSIEYKDEGVAVIRISDIKYGNVKPDKSVRVNEQKDYYDYVVQSGEILVAMSGATTGKFGIYKSLEKCGNCLERRLMKLSMN